MDAAVVEVNAVAQEVAKRHPKVHYVDTYKLFSDTDGTFAYDLPDEAGTTVTMRGGDGVHFTMDGADYLARQVYKLVDAQCGVTEQKVDGADEADDRDRGQHAGRAGLVLGFEQQLVGIVGQLGRRHRPDHAARDRAAHVATGDRTAGDRARRPPTTAAPPTTTAPPPAAAAP